MHMLNKPGYIDTVIQHMKTEETILEYFYGGLEKHWKQTIFLLSSSILLCIEAVLT